MMNDKELLKRALVNIEKQMDAIMQIFAGGRHLAGNSFDFNNSLLVTFIFKVPSEI